MADECEDVLKKYESRSKAISEEILLEYKRLVDNISEAHFTKLQAFIVNDLGKKFDLEKTVNVFKNNLYESLKTIFLRNWEETGLGTSVSLLEYSKSEAVDDETKWRPTNKRVTDQIRPHVINALNRKKMYFERQIRFQNGQLEQILQAVEEKRQFLRSFAEKRNQVTELMAKDEDRLPLFDQEIKKASSALLPKYESLFR